MREQRREIEVDGLYLDVEGVSGMGVGEEPDLCVLRVLPHTHFLIFKQIVALSQTEPPVKKSRKSKQNKNCKHMA